MHDYREDRAQRQAGERRREEQAETLPGTADESVVAVGVSLRLSGFRAVIVRSGLARVVVRFGRCGGFLDLDRGLHVRLAERECDDTAQQTGDQAGQ